jgi:histidinol-phosphate aminotransferase
MPRPNPLVESLPATIPFVAPETLEHRNGRPFKARLGANECNFGTSPMAVAAMEKAAREDVWKYCDPEIRELSEALAAHYAVAPAEEVVVGAGIDNLLGVTVRIFSDAGETIVSSLGAYPTFNYHVAGYGRKLVTVPFRDDREDLERAGRSRSAREGEDRLSLQSGQSDGYMVGSARRSRRLPPRCPPRRS